MTINLDYWWMFLCTLAAINIVAWSCSAAMLGRLGRFSSAENYSACRMQLALSAIYVLGCAFRSVVPLYDIPRLCLVDTSLCNVAVGRSVATLAELSFVAQWALVLRQLSKTTASVAAYSASRIVFPLICIAEIFSWYSVITTSNFGHVIEETLWGLSALLLVFGLVAMRSRCGRRLQWLLDVCCFTGICYVAYMFLVDVPMYWSRWIADEASGRTYLGIAEGIAGSAGRGTVSLRPEDWKNEVIWMSVYFSVAVWMSIAIAHFAPRLSSSGKDRGVSLSR